MTWLWVYLGLINIISFSLFGYDKSQAVRGGRRVAEKRLFWIAAAGGAAGAWLGMQKFRHKTKHASFVWGIPTLLAVNLLCLYWILTKL